ncbi:MAG: hypothetical protein ABFD97_18210 [Syntrophobacter sp.]
MEKPKEDKDDSGLVPCPVYRRRWVRQKYMGKLNGCVGCSEQEKCKSRPR